MIKTRQEKDTLENYLAELKETLFKPKGSFNHKLKSLPLPYSKLIRASLDHDKIISANPSGVKITLDKLTNQLRSMQEINLTIAFVPSQTTLERIYLWVKQNLGDNYLLNLSVDPEILGGAVIIYKGFYSNYSLAKQLQNVSVEKILKTYS